MPDMGDKACSELSGPQPLNPVLGELSSRFRALFEWIEKETKLLELIPALRPLTITRVEHGGGVYTLSLIPKACFRGLSPRQREVAVLMLAGWPRKAIAEHLGISLRTVDSHRERLAFRCKIDFRDGFVDRLLLGEASEQAT
jgi:ATP/maltotriose-dependent transcriptional regulator MalT